MTEKRAAIFDVDGTLVDTNHLHVVTWWEAFRQAGHRVPMHDVHRAVGLGSDDLIEHLLGKDRDPEDDGELEAAHRTLYATYFDRLTVLEGAGELLRALSGRGWEIVLATSASGGGPRPAITSWLREPSTAGTSKPQAWRTCSIARRPSSPARRAC